MESIEKDRGVKRYWKVLAIIELVIILSYGLLTFYVLYEDKQTLKKTNICYYEICGEYPDAYYNDGLCTCLENDLLGQLVPATTKIMN